MLRLLAGCIYDDSTAKAPEPPITQLKTPVSISTECPVCFVSPYLSSYACPNGHSICDVCMSQALRHPPSNCNTYCCAICRAKGCMKGKCSLLWISVCDVCGGQFGPEEKERNAKWLERLGSKFRMNKVQEGAVFAHAECRENSSKFGVHMRRHKKWLAFVPYAEITG